MTAPADHGRAPCRWNFTNTATNETQVFNGTCASPGSKSAGPWCYVEPDTCKHQPLKDQTGQSYDNCGTNSSTHTLDTCAPHTQQACMTVLAPTPWGSAEPAGSVPHGYLDGTFCTV